MTSISMLTDLIVGPSSFSQDLTNPNNKKKWEAKSKELDQNSRGNYWLKSLEASLYHTINVNSNSNLNLQRIVAKEVQGLKLEDRLAFYQRRIDIICSRVFSEVFDEVTKPNAIELDEAQRKLRWLINETNRIEDDNMDSIFAILKDFDSYPESEFVYVCNYFTAVYLKKSIIALYRQISIIDKETINDWQDDIFIKKSLVEKFDSSTYSALKDYTFKHMAEDSTYLIDLYSALKKIYYNSYSSQQSISWSEIDLKVEIRKLENLSFLIVIKDRLVGEKVELGLDEVLEGAETVIDKVYDEIRSELSQLKYPNDRIYLLGQKVNEIKEILEDEFVESNKYLLESIPRKLIRKLQSELEMIMANPKIDLKEFDRDKIKPVKTTVSVTQLAFLFKILEENKIIAPENRSDLYMAVCNSFMSKQTDSISPKSFQNHYLGLPDNSTKAFWKDKFMEFYNQIKVIK